MTGVARRDDGALITLDLTADERSLLRNGLFQWGGPARCSNVVARAIGFMNESELLDVGYSLAERIEAGGALTRGDWSRALLSTEIIFSSVVAGAAWDWPTVTGFEDKESLDLLRSIQRKFLRSLAP